MISDNSKKAMEDQGVAADITNKQFLGTHNQEKGEASNTQKDASIHIEDKGGQAHQADNIQNNKEVISCETKQTHVSSHNEDKPEENQGKNEGGVTDHLNGQRKTPNKPSAVEHIDENKKNDVEQQNNGAITHSSKAAEPHLGHNSNSRPMGKNSDLIGKETSKLQFLLSQPDIFEYLRKLNNGELESSQEPTGEGQPVDMEVDHDENANKRHAQDGKEEENSNSKEGYDNENVIEKIEVQPENLTFGKLRAYQLDALNWLNSLHEAKLNGILADEMGLGKTIESISIIALIEGRKTEEERK